MNTEAALITRLATEPRRVRRYKVLVDTTVRRVTLAGGGWRLWGGAAVVYYQTRAAADAAGTLATNETAAPVAADLVDGTAPSSPTAGIAFGTDGKLPGPTIGGSGSVVGSAALPADTTDYREIAVPANGFVNVYLMVAAGTANPVLEGPYE